MGAPVVGGVPVAGDDPQPTATATATATAAPRPAFTGRLPKKDEDIYDDSPPKPAPKATAKPAPAKTGGGELF